MKFFTVLIFIVFSGEFCFSQKDTIVRSTPEIRTAIFKNYKKASQDVKAIYDSLITFLSISSHPKKAAYEKLVINSQKSWDNYASNSCGVQSKLAVEGGQGGDSIYYSCYTEKASIRIAELKQDFENIKSDLSSN